MTDAYGKLRNEDEAAALAAILAQAFLGTPPESRDWLKYAGEENARVLRRNGAIEAGLSRLVMGQWFGGRSIPMVGIAAVGVAAQARGHGTATRLMQTALREMHDEGTPLSVLFAASYSLYRRVGYELAGSVHDVAVPLATLRGERDANLRPLRDEDRDAVRALQSEVVRARNGTLDRNDEMWNRVFRGRDGKEPAGYVVEGASGIEGYVVLVAVRWKGSTLLSVKDLFAKTPAAVRRILAFIGDHKAQIDKASWSGDVADPTVMHVLAGRYEVKLRDHWMLRVVDVSKALEARGYPAGVSGALHLDVHDDLIESNCGRLVLEVEGGRGRTRKGGEGTLKTSIRGLAPLYSGFMPPVALRQSGWIEADDEACERAANLFGGSAPFMYESF